MADFVKKVDEVQVAQNVDDLHCNSNRVEPEQICVISITNSHPYDISELKNNAYTFYTNINYKQLKELYHVIRHNSETKNNTYNTIKKYIIEKSAKVFFDFKCSGDCQSGAKFIDNDTTLLVFKVVNSMTRLGCNIVVGDHSMASLFNNWNSYRMDFPSPITVSTETTEGSYKMYGSKNDFINSDYPILKNLGAMSATDKVEIDFSNMSGTKVYKVNESENGPVHVQIISKGYPTRRNMRENDVEQVVHSEFVYRKGKIIISATHWCNLTEVQSDVNMDEVRKQYTTQFGAEESAEFEVEYTATLSTGNREEIKRFISDSVKYVCSGKKS
jgi:hypothetical protein